MTQTRTQLVHNKLAGVGRKWNLSLAAGFREFSPGKAIHFEFTILNYWHLISVLNCAAGVPVSSFSISAHLCPSFLWDSRTALLVLYSPLALMISSAELNYLFTCFIILHLNLWSWHSSRLLCYLNWQPFKNVASSIFSHYINHSRWWSTNNLRAFHELG